MKRHHTGIDGAASARPGDALIGNLFGDLRLPLLFFSSNIGFPMQMLVVELLDLLHAFHEFRKLFKLRPLVISGPHGDIDFDRLFNDGHVVLLSRELTSSTSLHIFLNDPCRSDLGLIGVLSRGTQGPPLPQEIPALIEFYLDAAQSCPIVIGQQLLWTATPVPETSVPVKRVLRSDEGLPHPFGPPLSSPLLWH